MTAPWLEVKGLRAFYGQTAVLHGIDFSMQRGGITTILGANGAGKTTILRALCGLVHCTGEIVFEQRRITGKATEAIARCGITQVPQGRGTFERLSVAENLRLGAISRRDRAGIAVDLERMFGYFPVLKTRYRQQAGTLSGGEQQMLAIARALLLRPRLLLLDEPSFGLAPLLVQDLFAILARINQEQQLSMLLVEQNAALALELADQAYLLETGRVVLAGPAADIRRDASVQRAYLGY